MGCKNEFLCFFLSTIQNKQMHLLCTDCSLGTQELKEKSIVKEILSSPVIPDLMDFRGEGK